MKLHFVLLLVLIAPCVLGLSIDIFASIPIVNTKLSAGSGAVVKIASDESMIVVGYVNGSVIGYSMIGTYMTTYVGPVNRIISVEWIAGVGPMSLDNTGTVYRWYKNGSAITNIVVGIGAAMMTLTFSPNTTYVAFNMGTQVKEYTLTQTGFTPIKIYTAGASTSFTNIMYSAGYNVLFVGTNTSQLLAYYCSTGNPTGSVFYLPSSSSTVIGMAPLNGQYVMLTSGSAVYSFNTNVNNVVSLGTLSTYSNVMTTCSNGSYIVTGSTIFSSLYIYSSLLIQQETLNYFFGTVRSLDCSSSYLVTLDSANYMSVTSYFSSDIPFAKWIIGVIVGGVVFVVVVIAIVICVICRRRQNGLQVSLNVTQPQELMITTPTNQYNTPFNNQYNNQYGTQQHYGGNQVYVEQRF